MSRIDLVGILLLSGLISLPAASQGNAGGAGPSPHPQAGAQKNNAGSGAQANHKMGDWVTWVREHKNLSPDQQQKLLESDPGFKQLPPARQAQLRERLLNFNSLTPQQQERALRQREIMNKLTPQQRQQLRDANQQLKGLPLERRVAIHTAIRHLRQMPADQRKQVLQSDRFRSTFSDQEQKLIGQLAELPDSGQNAQTK